MTSAPEYLVLGDDLTGSLEAGALYARSGTACVVSVSKGLPDGVSAEAVVVDTETRHLDPERASAGITKTIVDARARGISKIYLKVDSTLRGSIPAQLRGALAGWPGRSIVFTPAYPRMGRTVRADQLYVNDQLLTETAFARDPIDPARTSSISERLSAGECGSVIRITGARELRDALSFPVPSILVCDAESTEQLRDLACLVVDAGWPCVCAGSAGLLAELIAAEKRVGNKTGLIVNGSLNSTSLRQCATASSDLQVFTVGGESDEDALTSRITGAVQAEGWAVLSTTADAGDPECVLDRLAKVTAAVLRDTGCKSLTIFGGDTAAKILSTLNVGVIHPVRELLPGIPVSRITVEGRTLKLITKAGGFGDSDVVRQLRTALSAPE